VCLMSYNLQANQVLDVVDINDHEIGQATRGEIHEKGWFHRAVHILLFNSSGAVYIQRRSNSKDRHPMKLDSSAAGHVDSGETYLEAAKRELNEELGITADLTSLLNIDACPETDNEHIVIYEAHSDLTPIPNPEEIYDGAFIDSMELSDLMIKRSEDFVPAFILLWEQRMKALSEVHAT